MPPGARVVDVGYVGDIEFITCVFDQGHAAEPPAQPQAAAAAAPVPRQREQAGRKRAPGEEPPPGPFEERRMGADAGPARPHVCKFCGKGFRCNADLVAHGRTHTGEKPFPCIICLKAFSRAGHLTRHVTHVHVGVKRKREPDRYECYVCSKRFPTPFKLVTHERVHNGDRPFKCGFCKKAFLQKPHLNGRSPLCTRSCLTRWQGDWNRLLHT